MDVIVYIHGKGGSAEEADHYRSLFPSCDVLGLDVQSSLPWEAGKQIHTAVNELKKTYDRVTLIANSIGDRLNTTVQRKEVNEDADEYRFHCSERSVFHRSEYRDLYR